ncbi:hypothetical protein KCU61_g64, partial [Aureobasidium melanogenum]
MDDASSQLSQFRLSCTRQWQRNSFTIFKTCAPWGFMVVIRSHRLRIRRPETSVPTNCRASASAVARSVVCFPVPLHVTSLRKTTRSASKYQE